MADIILQGGLTVNKGIYFQRIMNAQQLSFSLASPNAGRVAQLISHLTPTALDISGLTALGVGWLENTDAYNYVDIGVMVSAAFYPLLRVPAGVAFPVIYSPDLAVAPYALAGTPAAWATNQGEVVNDLRTDPADASNWICLVAHTSRATGNMADDRAAHPTYWASYVADVILQAPIFDA